MNTHSAPEFDRIRGALLGLAVGDAVGTAVEFSRPGTFEPLTDMIGGGPFHLRPGEWTDDTSMALCLAESLVECGGFDAADQCRRYLRWRDEGHLSSNGRCFDIGGTTRNALSRFERTGNPFSGGTGEREAANGSLMRLAPVPLFFRADPAQAIHYAGESSKTTHALPICVDACRYYAGLILGALAGTEKDALLAPLFHPSGERWEDDSLHPDIETVARGSFLDKDPSAIRGTGYVVHALEAALWAFARSDDFRTGCLLAANLGDDADTTAAIYGQIAGAHYGADGIPEDWIRKLAKRDVIEELAGRLVAAS